MRFKIFDCYFLDISTDTHRLTIVSVKRRVEKILKPTVRAGMSYYRLYLNGIGHDFSLEELISKTDKLISFGHFSDKLDSFPNEVD